MKDLRNIVFDFGGVLLDWNPRHFYKNIFNEESELNFFLNEVCNQEWNEKQDAGRPFKDGITELINQHPQYKNEIEMYYTHWIDMVSGEIKENTAIISELPPEYLLFGLTNWSAETFPLVYHKYDFFKEFDWIVVSGQEKLIKPDPEIYKLLLSKYEIEAGYSLFIDDNEENINAAQILGFQTIHFQQGMNLREEMKKKGVKI